MRTAQPFGAKVHHPSLSHPAPSKRPSAILVSCGVRLQTLNPACAGTASKHKVRTAGAVRIVGPSMSRKASRLSTQVSEIVSARIDYHLMTDAPFERLAFSAEPQALLFVCDHASNALPKAY